MPHPQLIALLLLVGICTTTAQRASERGALIYKKQCASCHGSEGQGVDGEYDEPLTGKRSVEALKKLIERTMPEDDEDACVGEDAAAVAAYIFDAFYSPAAQAKRTDIKPALAHLTVGQYAQSIADVVSAFQKREKVAPPGEGLKANYYNGRRFSRKEHKLEREDPEVAFDFGAGSPLEGEVKAEAFSIQWRGSLHIAETGEYEFCVKTPNGIKLWVNDSGDAPLIDGWVSSGTMTEHRKKMRLLGGRAYPLRLDYFKFKDKHASIELRWTPPRQVEQVIPREVLSSASVSETFVITTPFPPDDSSFGYARGTAVSEAWNQATTSGAIETANHVLSRIERFAGTRREHADWLSAVHTLAHRFVERAFRRPLSEEEAAFFVDRWFDEGRDPEETLKRVILLALKSPRFLYPELAVAEREHAPYRAAARLALILWNSLPDDALLKVAAQGKLSDPNQLAKHAERLLSDSRAQTKVREFFHHWLQMNEKEEIAKDNALYPEFDEETVADLRTSLNLFIDDIVWSEASDFRQLLLADYLYLNGRIGDLLGQSQSLGERFQKITFDPEARSGVITHPYLLANFAYHQNTSPIHRGVFLTRQVLGRTLKPPPEAVTFDEARFDPHLTMREKVAELTKSKACQNCHSIINPLGFSLEYYDAVGRFRFEDKNKPIDAESSLPTLAGGELRLKNARDVAEHAASSPEAQRGFIQHLFEHLVKQPVHAYGADTMDTLHQAFVDSNYNMKKLMVRIATVASVPQTTLAQPSS